MNINTYIIILIALVVDDGCDGLLLISINGN